MSRPWDAGKEDIQSEGAVFQTRAVLQTDGLLQVSPPALKGGVTANVALQAGCIFQMYIMKK